MKKNSKKKKKFVSYWQGPEVDGISYSSLCKFFVCRERFRIKMVEGLEEIEPFDSKREYGTLFHDGLEGYSIAVKAGKKPKAALKAACKAIEISYKKLTSQFPDDPPEDIDYWRMAAQKQLPVYLEHWKKQDAKKIYVLEEEPFKVPYRLPSGRTVFLTGRIDGAFKLPKRKLLNLQENKTKGFIDAYGLQSGLHEDLQSLIYLIGLRHLTKETEFNLLYNVIKRPLSEKYPLRQKKDESISEFLTRVTDVMAEKPTNYFTRIPIHLTAEDINTFEQQSLIPILEQLCDWWNSIKATPRNPWNSKAYKCRKCNNSYTYKQIIKERMNEEIETRLYCPICERRAYKIVTPNRLHYRRPFGIYDGMSNGFRGDFFELIANGNKNGLRRKERSE